MRPLSPRVVGGLALIALPGGCRLDGGGKSSGFDIDLTRSEVSIAEPARTTTRPIGGPPSTVADDEVSEMARLVREAYTKHEFRIPMRDGVKLHTVVYVPKDRAKPAPMIMLRTPYSVGPYGVDHVPDARAARTLQRMAPSIHFVRAGYILVHQDVRGKLMSEGTFVDVRPYVPTKKTPQDIDESSDAHDTIDWLVHNVEGHNGRVGAWGVSYPGFYAAQAAIDAHPALKAVSPQAPVTDWFVGDDVHHHGAFFLADNFGFYANFGRTRSGLATKIDWNFQYGTDDLYAYFLRLGPLSNANELHFKGQIPFWNEMMEHGNLDDFWKARNPLPHYRSLKPAVLTVGGWFDAEDLYGTLATYRAIERQSPGARSSLVMGPWRHGGWARSDGDSLGDVSFATKTSVWYRREVEFPFFERHLRDVKPKDTLPEVWSFTTGINEWHRETAWPPPGSREQPLWLLGDGLLAARAPTAGGYDEFVSDPRKPVPYRSRWSGERGADYMIDDQRFAGSRPDVLVYETPPLEGDVTLSGPLTASIWLSTTGTDADVIVKLIDVYPDGYPAPEPNPRELTLSGYQQLVRAEVMRGKFRHSYEHPEAFVPGEPTLVRFALPDVDHTFRAGHRLMVQVQSSWFPLVDRNPQTFVDIYRATAADFHTATHRVHRDPAHASQLTVTLRRGTLPSAPP